ncbi:D-Ala-D-Ala carboxypeptidase VanY [Paenibacillus sp. UNC451MF]|uniref:D-Ala-D-Ala carboxypeptidase VanY n=1 Tax=Paenibacillus sp. UNC451MF TaxID=1449063 RepID=UPI00048D5CC0|nr:D-Ala-D-Ala carboxypeptidase VanY [Paenibacillus sp. UNC451MF]
MKKWVFLLVVVLLLGYEAVQHKMEDANGSPEHEEAKVQSSSSAAVQTKQGKLSKQTIAIAKDQVYKGKLVLVNKKYAVHEEGIQSDVVRLFSHKELIKGFALLDNTIRLSQDVTKSFGEMVEAADKDGVRHFMISSGYRNEDEQDELYQEMGSDYALPAGNSEHNLGLSLDIGSTQMEMNQAPEGKWLIKNASKYGFVLRYPKDKTAITGIQYEPWHFRYVGLPHSVIMKEKNMTMEEYLDYIKEQKNLSTQVEGIPYEISYYRYSKNMTISIPDKQRYDISGDNRDGIIVTMYP